MAETPITADALPPDVAQQLAPAPAQSATAGVPVAESAAPVERYDLPADVAQALLPAAALHDYQDQKLFGEGVSNVVTAGIESGFNQAMLGAGDAIMVAAGAQPEALRQRRERNQVAAAIGGAGGFVLPILLTGGEAGLARAGLESAEGVAAGASLGLKAAAAETAAVAGERAAARASSEGLTGAIRFMPTTAGASKLGEAVQVFTERALAERPIAGKLAGVVARNAAEGGLYGTGSAISDVVRDGDDVLGDHETAAEYMLYHAAEGGLFGAALGGVLEGGAQAIGGVARKAGEGYRAAREAITSEAPVAFEAPASVARAGAAQAKAAEGSAAAQRAMQEAERLNTLPEYVAPKSEREASKMIERIVAQQTGDAAGARAAVEDVTARLNRMQTAKESVERVVSDATVDVTQKVSRRAEIMDELQSKFSISRKSRQIDEAIRGSADVAPVEVVAAEGADYVRQLKSDLELFRNDPDGKVASVSRRLTGFVDEADLQMRKALAGEASQAEVHQSLDSLKRVIGHARARMPANAGDMEARNLPGILQGRYAELATQLSDAGLYGEKVAAIQAKNNAAWTQFLDVASGFEKDFLRTGESGAGKTASGWGALAQGDSGKLGSLIDGMMDARNSTRLSVFTQGLDSGTALIEQLAQSLKASPEETALVKELRKLTSEIGDHMKTVAQTHADVAEYRAMQGAVGAREKAFTEAERLQGKSAELGEAAREKADLATADVAAAKDTARGKATEAKADAIRKGLGPLVTGAAAATAIATGLPWWSVGGAIPLSSIVGQALARHSSEKLIAATAAGFRATDRAATAIAEYATRTRTGKAVSTLVSNVKRGSVALAAGDSRQNQYERVRARLDELEQQPDSFAQSSPQAAALARTPMLMTTVAGKRGNAIAFLRGKLPAEFRPVMAAPQLDHQPRVNGVQVRQFLRYARAVNDPRTVLADAARGDVTPEGFEALRAVYPKIHDQLVSKIFDKLATATQQPSMRDAQNLSLITGVPMHFTMTPEFVAGYQAVYADSGGEVPVDTDAQAMPRARNVTAKTPGMYATSTQRVENGLGR